MSLALHVQTLGRGPGRSRALTDDEAADAMRVMLQGDAAPEAVGALLMLLRMKGETADEIAGFSRAAQAGCRICQPPIWTGRAMQRAARAEHRGFYAPPGRWLMRGTACCCMAGTGQTRKFVQVWQRLASASRPILIMRRPCWTQTVLPICRWKPSILRCFGF
jgi:hypothetical protein